MTEKGKSMSACRAAVVVGLLTSCLASLAAIAGEPVRRGEAQAMVAPSTEAVAAQSSSASFNHCSQPGGVNTTIFMEFSVTSSSNGARTRTCEISAVCVDSETGLFFQNVDVEWTLETVPFSGSHAHHNSARPIGALESYTGNTGDTGIFTTTYTVPEVSGKIKATLTCSHPSILFGDGVPFFWEIRNNPSPLDELARHDSYVLIGSEGTPHGSANHAGTPELNSALFDLTRRFAERFPGEKLSLNDMSLPWGGLFDLNANWQPPHFWHRFGTDVDIRVIDRTPQEVDAIRQLAKLSGFRRIILEKSPPHYHLQR